uniref:Leucine rich repeat containing 20 n=1 Tax=Malurus cyaneus samueli TaxID=2593467 RepID=A0A8C5X7Q0_9PASS
VPYFSQLEKELNLAGNYLHRLPEEITSLLHLRAIDLSRNRFRRFPEPLATVPTLETIDLEENEIAEVPTDKLASMASLRSLNLRANPVGVVPIRAVWLRSVPAVSLFPSQTRSQRILKCLAFPESKQAAGLLREGMALPNPKPGNLPLWGCRGAR